MKQDTPLHRVGRSESDEDSIKGLFEDIGFWGHLYLAGWGLIIAAGTGLMVLVALFHPELIHPGQPWIDGPWYASLSVRIVGAYVTLGGVGIGFKWTIRHLEAAFPMQMGRFYFWLGKRLMEDDSGEST